MKKEVNTKELTINLDPELSVLEPSLYQVIVHNDDFTPMEFVVGVLESFFYMDRHKAIKIMHHAHVKGQAVCGIFSREVAESKTSEVIEYSQRHDHPLLCSMESIMKR